MHAYTPTHVRTPTLTCRDFPRFAVPVDNDAWHSFHACVYVCMCANARVCAGVRVRVFPNLRVCMTPWIQTITPTRAHTHGIFDTLEVAIGQELYIQPLQANAHTHARTHAHAHTHTVPLMRWKLPLEESSIFNRSRLLP